MCSLKQGVIHRVFISYKLATVREETLSEYLLVPNIYRYQSIRVETSYIAVGTKKCKEEAICDTFNEYHLLVAA